MTFKVYNLPAKLNVKSYFLWQKPAVTQFCVNFLLVFYLQQSANICTKVQFVLLYNKLYCKLAVNNSMSHRISTNMKLLVVIECRNSDASRMKHKKYLESSQVHFDMHPRNGIFVCSGLIDLICFACEYQKLIERFPL